MDENRYYTTVQGDMWDSIAYQFYGDTKYIGLLFENNQDLLDIFCLFGRNEGIYSGTSGRRRRRYSGMEIVNHESTSGVRCSQIQR